MQEQLQAIDALIQRREVKKAEILIAKCLRTDLNVRDQVALLIQRARTRLLSARPEDGINDLLTARSLVVDDFEKPVLWELLGDCYFAQFELASVGFADRNDAVQAQTIYQQISANFPEYYNLGWVHYQLGRVHLTDNQINQAVNSFQQSLLNPSSVTALTAYCYERLGFIAFYDQRDLNKALGFLNKAVDTYPITEDPLWLVQVHILRSRVLHEMPKYDQALQAAEAALIVASKTRGGGENKLALAEALFTTGELLSKLEGREKDVVGYLQQFLQVSKKPLGVDVTFSRVYEMLGDALFRLGQYDESASAYLVALQFNPYHPWEASVYYRVARSYYYKHNYEKSIEAIQRVLQVTEADGQTVDDYRVYDVLGNAQFALGHYDKAITAYQAALKIAPPTADVDNIRTYYAFAQERSQSAL